MKKNELPLITINKLYAMIIKKKPIADKVQSTENLKLLNKIKGLITEHHKELISMINEEMKKQM